MNAADGCLLFVQRGHFDPQVQHFRAADIAVDIMGTRKTT
jgi:hypothetical protein